MANISHYAASNDVDCSYTIAIAKTVTFVGGLILAKGDQFWLPKSVRPDLFWQQKWSGGTSFSAKIGPAGPILGGTDFGVTVRLDSIFSGLATLCGRRNLLDFPGGIRVLITPVLRQFPRTSVVANTLACISDSQHVRLVEWELEGFNSSLKFLCSYIHYATIPAKGPATESEISEN